MQVSAPVKRIEKNSKTEFFGELPDSAGGLGAPQSRVWLALQRAKAKQVSILTRKLLLLVLN